MKPFKSVRELARQVANLDGKNLGLNQKEAEKALKYAVALLATYEASGDYEGALATFNRAVVLKVKKIEKNK